VDVYLSHNWGKDSQGRDNHARVKLLQEHLVELGLTVRFDDSGIEGQNTTREITEAIGSCKVCECVVCVCV
jgi:hypothetical protein